MRFLTILSAIIVTAAWGLNSSIGKMAVSDLQVVFGIMGGVVFFSDILTYNVWVGSILICIGVLIATLTKKEKTI
ncbi:MAG: hypothetical protein IJW72_00530 [Alphaproteobacteria bacterium]|nr:hypothetical protein [Alphaproteobacteria bacterium]